MSLINTNTEDFNNFIKYAFNLKKLKSSDIEKINKIDICHSSTLYDGSLLMNVAETFAKLLSTIRALRFEQIRFYCVSSSSIILTGAVLPLLPKNIRNKTDVGCLTRMSFRDDNKRALTCPKTSGNLYPPSENTLGLFLDDLIDAGTTIETLDAYLSRNYESYRKHFFVVPIVAWHNSDRCKINSFRTDKIKEFMRLQY